MPTLIKLHANFALSAAMRISQVQARSQPSPMAWPLTAAIIGTSQSISARITACTRSEEHTSELQSLMRISYAVFCLKKKTNKKHQSEKSYELDKKKTKDKYMTIYKVIYSQTKRIN